MIKARLKFRFQKEQISWAFLYSQRRNVLAEKFSVNAERTNYFGNK